MKFEFKEYENGNMLQLLGLTQDEATAAFETLKELFKKYHLEKSNENPESDTYISSEVELLKIFMEACGHDDRLILFFLPKGFNTISHFAAGIVRIEKLKEKDPAAAIDAYLQLVKDIIR